MISRGYILLSLLLGCSTLWAQGHCVKVSIDVTFLFGIETSPAEEPHGLTFVDQYHTDLELSFRSAGWDVLVSYDAPGSGSSGLDLDPNKALLYGSSLSKWVLSSVPPAFEFIGAEPGDSFWVLPQNSGTGALPLGVAVERADSSRLCSWNPGDARGADTEDIWFEMKLLEVRGPADANFAMWQADGLRPPVVFVSTHENGIADEDVFYISKGSHVHLNWGFTQPGLYEIDFKVSTIVHCDPWLTADWAPLGDTAGTYYGDGKVDLLDFAHLAAHWKEVPDLNDPNTAMFVDPNDPNDPVNDTELLVLMDQWLACGYPGCE